MLLKIWEYKHKHFQQNISQCRSRSAIQILSVLAISIGHFIDGMVLAYPSSAVPSLRNSTTIDTTEEDLDFISEHHFKKDTPNLSNYAKMIIFFQSPPMLLVLPWVVLLPRLPCQFWEEEAQPFSSPAHPT